MLARHDFPVMTPTAPAGQRRLLALTPVDLLVANFQRWYSRARTRSAVLALSPRLRADIGLDQANIDAAIAKAVDDAHEQRLLTKRLARARRQAVQRTRRDLLALDDRELDDIGIARRDIDRIARATKIDMAEIIAANPYAFRDTGARAANDVRHEAVA